MAPLKVNDTFPSYKALQEVIEEYEKEHRVQFWKRDAKRINAAAHCAPQIYSQVRNHPDLEYYYIKYACIHGGEHKYKPHMAKSGKRRTSRGSWKHNCKAEISVRLAKDAPVLTITNIIEEHNHEIPSREAFNQLPKQRRLLNATKNEKKQKKSTDNKNELLKNILKTNSASRSNNFKKIANLLQEKYSCVVDLQVDADGKVYGFLFQDEHMQTSFESFPEVFFTDQKYKPQNINCTVCILSVENSFGILDVVGVAVLTTDDSESVEWMIHKFKERNPNSVRIKVIVTDKQTNPLVRKEFPDTSILISQPHLSLILEQKILTQTLNLTFDEFEQFVDYFVKLTAAPSEENYQKILETMENDLPCSAMQYFYKNWNENRNEWANAFTKKTKLLVNNKLESATSRLKSVTTSCKNFNEFIEKFFTTLESKRDDFRSEFIKTVFKRNKNQQSYHHHLTQFAYSKIESFLDSEKEYSIKEDGSLTICETKKNKRLVISTTRCSCYFFTVVGLPCKHIIFYRKSMGLDGFDEGLFSERWTKRYVRSAFAGLYLSEQPLKVERDDHDKEERVKQAQTVCLELAKLCSQMSENKFAKNINLLKEIQQSWQRGEEVEIVASQEEIMEDKIEICEDEPQFSNQDVKFHHVEHNYFHI